MAQVPLVVETVAERITKTPHCTFSTIRHSLLLRLFDCQALIRVGGDSTANVLVEVASSNRDPNNCRRTHRILASRLRFIVNG